MVAYGAWQHYNEPQPVSSTADAHNRVIMYSLTTCGYCKQKARELNTAGIAFTEYFIDKKWNDATSCPKSWRSLACPGEASAR